LIWIVIWNFCTVLTKIIYLYVKLIKENHHSCKAFYLRTIIDYSCFSRNKFVQNNTKGVHIYFRRRRDTATRVSVNKEMEPSILHFWKTNSFYLKLYVLRQSAIHWREKELIILRWHVTECTLHNYSWWSWISNISKLG